MTRQLLALAGFVVFVSCSAVSCSRQISQPPNTATRTVTDDLGRVVELPQQVTRAISLAPSITETVFAAGAGDRLVAVTTFCNYPEATTNIEKVGDTLTPNIERIIALKPQIVFVSTDSQLQAFLKTLEEQGIVVYVTNAQSLDTVLKNMIEIGKVLGTEDAARTEVDRLKEKIESLEKRIELNDHWEREIGIQTPRVFVQFSNEPLFTIGKESFLTELLTKAGGVSVTKDVPTAYPKLSKETAVALDPDVIILSDSEDNREPNDAFRNSPAVKQGRVFKINADIVSRPGPRLVDALEQLVDKIQKARI